MTDAANTVPTLDDKHSVSDASLEKKGAEADVSDDARMAKEVEEFEDRLQHDEAAEEEYLVQEAYEVAIKVRTSLHSFLYPRLTVPAVGLVDPRRARSPLPHLPHLLPRPRLLGLRSVRPDRSASTHVRV